MLEIIIPLFLSLLIGFAATSLMSERAKVEPYPFFSRWVLPLALGLGLSAHIVFYTLMIRNSLSMDFLIYTHMVVLIVLIGALGVFKYIKHVVGRYVPAMALSSLIFSFWLVISFDIFKHQPYGGWDAWALWQFRANFVFRAAEEWVRIFQFAPLARHPWGYSFLIDWSWTLAGENQWTIYLIYVLFFLGLVTLYFCFIAQRKGFMLAVGGIFLLLFPAWFLQAFKFYADLPLAFYLLLTVIQGCIFYKNRSPANLYLAVVLCALLSFWKNEGLLFSMLLMLVFLRISPGRLRPRALFVFILGFIPTFFSGLLMLNPSHGINTFSLHNLLNGSRWLEAFSAIMATFVSLGWWGIAWLITLSLILFKSHYWKDEYFNLIKLSILAFLVILILQYVGYNNDVGWRVNVTFSRELFNLWPVVCFMLLYQFPPLKNEKDI